MKRQLRIIDFFRQIASIALSIVIVMPFVVALVNSLKTKGEASTMSLKLPAVPQWENYAVVIQKGKLLMSFFNSFLYSGASVLICVVLAVMAAYVISRNRTKVNRMIYYYLVLGIVLPNNVIALMKIMQGANMNNTQFGLVCIYAALNIPFSVYLAYNFISTVPVELDEAGVLDGCTGIGLFFRIVLPLLKPVVVTVFVLNFLGVWSDFVMPLYFLNTTKFWPMTLAVYNFFGRYEMQWNLVAADIILTSLPVVVIYILGQRFIVSGMTAGAVKG